MANGAGLNLRIAAWPDGGFAVEFMNSKGDEVLMRVFGFATDTAAQSFARKFMISLVRSSPRTS